MKTRAYHGHQEMAYEDRVTRNALEVDYVNDSESEEVVYDVNQ